MTDITTLKDLCSKLVEEFSNTNSLKSMTNLVAKYNGKDWQDYITFTNESYNRILIFQSAYFDAYLICWLTNQKTKIHDHPSQGCLMKVLDGKLEENMYKNNNDLTFISSNILDTNEIGYRINNQILHQIIAKSNSVSLHIYSPKGYQTNFYEKS